MQFPKKQFKFLPLFLLFFIKLNTLPPSINYKHLQFLSKNTFNYFFRLLNFQGNFFKFYVFFISFCSFFWKQMYKSRLFFFVTNYLIDYSLFFCRFIHHFKNFFNSFKFLFFFYHQKLNKNLYKYAKYKRPRFSVIFFYLPPYQRMKKLLKYVRKSLVFLKGRTLKKKFFLFLWSFFFNKKSLFFLQFIQQLQLFIFKKQKRLFFL